MYKHILVALDGRPESEQALKQAVGIAQFCHANLTSLSIIEHLPAYAALVGEVDEAIQESDQFFHKLQDHAVKVAQLSGVALNAITRKGNAAQTIIRFAIENGIDLIVVGAASHRGLGSTADKVTENAPCSVLVARIDLPSIQIKNVMTQEVFSISPSTPLSQVVKLMIERGLKALPVVEEGKVVGIITGGDLLSRAGMEWRLSIQRILPERLFAKQIQRLSEEGKTARDIMTTPVITTNELESVEKAAQIMIKHQFKRLPVLNEQGEMTGIISRMDILALAASWGLSNEIFPAMNGTVAQFAEDIMFRDVPTVAPDAPISEVINEIVSTPLRRVVVVDTRRRVLGIIVDTNLIKAAQSEKSGSLQNLLNLFSTPREGLVRVTGQASDIMDRHVFTVRPGTAIEEVIQLMIDKRIKRLVVTDNENCLMGMVSRESILKLLIA
jgi:CBS domain-containing protein/nucleotide-binding universal stress UspA family protein